MAKPSKLRFFNSESNGLMLKDFRISEWLLNFSNLQSLFIWLNNVRKMIEMALKLLFLSQNHKNCPAIRGSAPQAPSVIRLSCSSLVSTGPKLDNFCRKEINFWLKPLPLSKILVALLVTFWLQTDFSSHYEWAAYKTSMNVLCVFFSAWMQNCYNSA